MSQFRIDEQRIYEGEWRFCCCTKDCNGFQVEYSLNEYEDYADNFLHCTAAHKNAYCQLCSGTLVWVGYSGGSPISDSFVALLKDKHYMAATVILSAIIENSLSNLLWSALVESGVESSLANKVADGRMSRLDIINTVASLTDLEIKDISFPSRNLVAHGKGFMRDEESYRVDLQRQIIQIRKWVERMLGGRIPNNFMPTECERWLLFMNHWSRWLVDYVDLQLLNR